MNKKSIIFLINGLGIESPGSYSISIDQEMPNLSRLKETSYFTTAVTNSLEENSAYQQFFIGDSSSTELDIIKNEILTSSNLNQNGVYLAFKQLAEKEEGKVHIFVEPTNEKVVDQINTLVQTLTLPKDKEIYLHLILPQLSVGDYKKLVAMINYIKYHIDTHITVGFIIGKESFTINPDRDTFKKLEKLFFYCSAERWSETEKKFDTLKEKKIIPCNVEGFCSNNKCFISNGDTIFFFNTRREDYDKFIKVIYTAAPEVTKGAPVNIPAMSLIKLNSVYNINAIAETINYENSLANQLEKYNKKCLILADQDDINLLNFDANGLNNVNNPRISFMITDDNLKLKEVITNLIDNMDYDLYIFNYSMDINTNINDIKAKLRSIDKVLGPLGEICENRHSLFISSLYGMKKRLPLAEYNTEMVTINYEMQIPIFFFDYTYPRSGYVLLPGDTNLILGSALWCINGNKDIDSLIRPKGILKNLFGKK